MYFIENLFDRPTPHTVAHICEVEGKLYVVFKIFSILYSAPFTLIPLNPVQPTGYRSPPVCTSSSV